MTMTHRADGTRVIELYVPFDWAGRRIDKISISALRLDHVLRWQKGQWQDSFDMLVEMSRPPNTPLQDQTWPETLRQLRYPDADRVLAAFYDMLPPQIQVAISKGEIPIPTGPVQRQAVDEPYQPDDDDRQAVFDLEEQPPEPSNIEQLKTGT